MFEATNHQMQRTPTKDNKEAQKSANTMDNRKDVESVLEHLKGKELDTTVLTSSELSEAESKASSDSTPTDF